MAPVNVSNFSSWWMVIWTFCPYACLPQIFPSQANLPAADWAIFQAAFQTWRQITWVPLFSNKRKRYIPFTSSILKNHRHDVYILSVYTYILHIFTCKDIVVHISSEDFVGTPQLPASNVATRSHVLALTPVTPARQTDCRACCAACDWWVADFPPVTPALLSDCRACRCCDWWVAGFKNRCWMVFN